MPRSRGGAVDRSRSKRMGRSVARAQRLFSAQTGGVTMRPDTRQGDVQGPIPRRDHMAVVRWNPGATCSPCTTRSTRAAVDEGRGRGSNWRLSSSPCQSTAVRAGGLHVEASVPGFEPERVVTFENGVLGIKGTHEESRDDRRDGYVRCERRIGSVYARSPFRPKCVPTTSLPPSTTVVITDHHPRRSSARPSAPGQHWARRAPVVESGLGRIRNPGAQEGTRTLTTLRSPAPQAGVSTNSTTWASPARRSST